MAYLRGTVYVFASTVADADGTEGDVMNIWEATSTATVYARQTGWAADMRERHGVPDAHLNAVQLDMDTFDALVAMRWAEMSDAEREAATARADERHGGNRRAAALTTGRWGRAAIIPLSSRYRPIGHPAIHPGTEGSRGAGRSSRRAGSRPVRGGATRTAGGVSGLRVTYDMIRVPR